MPNTDPVFGGDNQVLAGQVYDMIMAEIEPDLLLVNIPGLDARYLGETPDEHTARMERYQAAYKRFDLALQKFMDEINTNVRSSQIKSLKEREDRDRRAEQESLKSLTSAFH
jgi:hypothetical protein